MEQLLFPFVLDLVYEDYLTKELPLIASRHREYVIKTHDPMNRSEFIEYHYTNMFSPYYNASSLYNKEDMRKQKDGTIVDWDNYRS